MILSKKNKIFIYDVFTELYSRHKLLPLELYIYCFLYINRNHQFITSLSAEYIHQNSPIKFHRSRANINRQLITKSLISLKDKGIISYDVDDSLLKDNRNGKYVNLHITFNRFTEDGGYTQILYEEFHQITNINHFYISIATRRYDDIKHSETGLYGRWISEKEFGSLLGVTDDTFRKYANEMIAKGELFKLTGKKKDGSEERDKNRYRTKPFPNQDNYKKKEKNKGVGLRRKIEIETPF